MRPVRCNPPYESAPGGQDNPEQGKEWPISHDRFPFGFLSRTPGPPPSSSMKTIPAASKPSRMYATVSAVTTRRGSSKSMIVDTPSPDRSARSTWLSLKSPLAALHCSGSFQRQAARILKFSERTIRNDVRKCAETTHASARDLLSQSNQNDWLTPRRYLEGRERSWAALGACYGALVSGQRFGCGKFRTLPR